MTRENKGTADSQSTGRECPGVKPGEKRGAYKSKKRDDLLAELGMDSGVKRKPGKQRGHLQTMSHGLYFDVTKFQIDGRSSLGKQLYKVLTGLLEPFSKPVLAPAEMLARRTAYKLMRAASFEAYVLSGGKPATSTDQDYLRLTGSIRADIQLLHIMAKGSNGGDAPDLKEYLEAIRKAAKATPIIKVKAEDDSQD